jgi:hypothetical protein
VSIINDKGDGNCMVLSQADTTTQSSTTANGGKAQPKAQTDTLKNVKTNQNQENGNNGGQTGQNQANGSDKTTGKINKRMIRKRMV